MASQTVPVAVTGACQLVVPPKAPIAPSAWVGTPAKLLRMDRLCALGLVACDGALLDAGLQPGGAAWNGDRTAVILGTAYGCHATNEDYYRGVVDGTGASPRLFAYTLPSSPVGEISIHYGIRGPAAAVTAGLHAGLDALRAGVRELTAGRADRVLVAAADVATPLLERLIGRELADGAAALVLERVPEAAARGARILGRVESVHAVHVAGDRAAAVTGAARLALSESPGPVAELLAAFADGAPMRALGIEALPHGEACETLGAAPLVALARRLRAATGRLLLVAGDPEGGAACAVVTPAP